MISTEPADNVVVIGGGLAGLAAATYLARGGRSVRLFEQAHDVGGRARTKERDGFYFNVGPHALYRGGPGMSVLKDLGVIPKGKIPSVSGGFAIRGGTKHTLPTGLVSLLTTNLFSLSEKLEMARWLQNIPKLDPARFAGVSCRTWLDENITHDRVREFMLALFRVSTYVNSPDRMSAGDALEQLQLAVASGVLYLDHGWQPLVDALRRAALEAGAVIEVGTKVEKIDLHLDGAIAGVRLANGQLHRADTVVVAAGPSVVRGLLSRQWSDPLARLVDEAIPIRAACLDVALTRLPVPRSTFALGIDAPLYLSVHSAAAKLAPSGSAVIQVAKYVSPDDETSNTETERELEGLLDLIQPAWPEVLAHKRFLPDLVVANWLPQARHNGKKGRPSPEIADVPGLFIAGDWVGEKGLLADAALASAREAASLILQHEPAKMVSGF